MLFWIVAGLATAVVAGLLLAALLRWRGAATPPAEASDVQVYRDQLAEVERDVARGTLAEDEAQRLRLEVSRRLLEADRAAQSAHAGTAAPPALRYAGIALVVAGLAGALAVYTVLGAPGYSDMPLSARIKEADAARATRPPQEQFEATVPPRQMPPQDARYRELMDLLRAALEENPQDRRGLELLAVNEARTGNFVAAYQAQERLIEAKGDEATAEDHADLADLMILAAGGYVSPEAEAALSRALELDPRNGPARYYFGLSFAQTGRPDVAFRIWNDLLAASGPGAPWVRAIEAQMPDLARLAGVRWSPPDRRGPTAEDIAAASDMAPEDRLAMIRGMVEGLAARLAEDGGPPEDWARLISSLGVLGETEEASAIWTEAQTVFAEAPEALATIRTAAESAGVAE